MQDAAIIIGIVGGSLGALSFTWRWYSAFYAYAKIDLEITANKRENRLYLEAATAVEIISPLPRRIHYAALLIFPQAQPLKAAIASLSSRRPYDHQRLFDEKPHQQLESVDQATILVPLPAFYREQRYFGQECVRLGQIVDVSALPRDQPYRVTFIVFTRHFRMLIRWFGTSTAIFVQA